MAPRKRFILDASTTLNWAFPDEEHPIAFRAEEILRAGAADAAVPPLWWYEVRNVLLVNERRGRTTAALGATFLEELRELPIVVLTNPNEAVLFNLARETKLTIYDASYLALAIQHCLPLATLDKALQSAALLHNVPLLG